MGGFVSFFFLFLLFFPHISSGRFCLCERKGNCGIGWPAVFLKILESMFSTSLGFFIFIFIFILFVLYFYTPFFLFFFLFFSLFFFYICSGWIAGIYTPSWIESFGKIESQDL